jgi:hypothetical protein
MGAAAAIFLFLGKLAFTRRQRSVVIMPRPGTCARGQRSDQGGRDESRYARFERRYHRVAGEKGTPVTLASGQPGSGAMLAAIFGIGYFVSEPRKHHYIPVCYLKQWASTDDRRLCEHKLSIYSKGGQHDERISSPRGALGEACSTHQIIRPQRVLPASHGARVL